MALTFTRLSITNFGPYFETQAIDLETPSESPVVLIYGENTLGKTQLFSALRWCLYGTFTPQQTVPQAKLQLAGRLNRPAKRDGHDNFEVAIEFNAEGSHYVLTRHATVDGSISKTSADLRVGATVIPSEDIEEEIGRLLHPQISEFFLFDAELLDRFYERLETDRERAFIKASIEAVLGIPALQRAHHDVEELANDALVRQTKSNKSARDAKEIEKKLLALKSDSKSVEQDRKDLAADIDRTRAELREVREQLKAIEGLEADVREQELLDANVKDGKREEEELRLEMRSLFSGGWMSLAVGPLSEALDRVRKANSQYAANSQSIADAKTRVAVLEDRARGGDCPTCSQPLPPPDEETSQQIAEAKAEYDRLKADAGSGTLDLQLERRVSALVDDKSIPQYCRLQRRLSELQVVQYERKMALEAINDRLKGNKAADVRALGAKNKKLEAAAAALDDAQQKNEQRAREVTSEQGKLARKLSRLPGANATIVLEAEFYQFVRTVLEGTIDQYREHVRSKVQIDAQEMFLALVRDSPSYGGLRISNDYNIELMDRHDDPIPTSAGGKQLLALSLIGALKKAAVRGGPVVLDSPLARLDLKHRENVLKMWIPSLGSQAILLIQSGELTREQASAILGTHIGRSYEICRPTGDSEVAVLEKAM